MSNELTGNLLIERLEDVKEGAVSDAREGSLRRPQQIRVTGDDGNVRTRHEGQRTGGVTIRQQ